VVHHVQAAAAALRVPVVAVHHVQAAVVPLVPVVAAPHAQVAMAPRVLQVLEEARLVPVVRVAVHHVQAAAAFRAIAAAPAVVVIVADHAVVPVAVLRSVVLSQPRWTMIFNKRKKPSSWKV
jgi:hypothetical protein